MTRAVPLCTMAGNRFSQSLPLFDDGTALRVNEVGKRGLVRHGQTFPT